MVWLTLVSVFVILTEAPGITPEVSRTVPEIVPRVSWAAALSGTSSPATRHWERRSRKVRRMCSPYRAGGLRGRRRAVADNETAVARSPRPEADVSTVFAGRQQQK